jgi:catechol 2,3-dioxygenase-like lactoylglutathione lyase family enzyme
MKIDRLDHLVLTVADVTKTCEFYERVLGMETVTFGAGRKALAFGQQKINLHQAGKEFEPKAVNPTRGSGDLCFIASTQLPEVVEHLKGEGIAILEGPVPRNGATGPMESIYFRDLDGNLIEVSNYIDES